MKAIGTTKAGYLIEMSRSEIGALVGEHYLSSEDADKICAPGTEIDLKPWADSMTWLRDNRTSLRSTARTLSGYAEKLEAVPEPFDFAATRR